MPSRSKPQRAQITRQHNGELRAAQIGASLITAANPQIPGFSRPGLPAKLHHENARVAMPWIVDRRPVTRLNLTAAHQRSVQKVRVGLEIVGAQGWIYRNRRFGFSCGALQVFAEEFDVLRNDLRDALLPSQVLIAGKFARGHDGGRCPSQAFQRQGAQVEGALSIGVLTQGALPSADNVASSA